MLVLGHTGFIGSEIFRILSNDSENLVSGISSSEVVISDESGQSRKVVSAETSSLEMLGTLKFDKIFLASNLFTKSRRLTKSYRAQLQRVNVDLPLQVVANCSHHGTQVANLSSFWTQSASMASLPYSKSKRNLEELLARKFSHLQTWHLYLTDSFGPRDTRGKVTEQILQACLRGEEFRPSNPDSVISLSYVSDLAASLVKEVDSTPARTALVLGQFIISVGNLSRAASGQPFFFDSKAKFMEDNGIQLSSHCGFLQVQGDHNLVEYLRLAKESA